VRRMVGITAAAAGGLVVAVALGWLAWAWHQSRLPSTYSVMDYAIEDDGGKPVPEHAMHMGTSVADLKGPKGEATRHFNLTAEQADVRLPSGRVVHALTFDGAVPGPELRVREGDLVEVTLRNRDVKGGVTIHWHGVDVPNAEDGVAGVTQDAVAPGGSYTYRFRAEQVGTFWYHTHQSSSAEVRRGLYGALVIEPLASPRQELDLPVVVHTLEGIPLVNKTDGVERWQVTPATDVRLRLVNTDSGPHRFDVGGTPFRVLAIDGTELHGATPLAGRTLVLAAGGRYDIGFRMPARPVRLSVEGTFVGLVLSLDGAGNPTEPVPGPVFDPASYGTPAPTPFDAASHFDREFTLKVTKKPGFFDGRPGMQWAINGGIFPRVPMLVVERGDLVKVTIENATNAVHPMHLHGHHMLVLSRNGKPTTGSPWWSDTLNVEPDESYEVAFRADNPGLWMDHCHNLAHAAAGLTMHVAYAGVTTPYVTGGAAHNHPE
jgi:FtsP/CotA-like multicopper oxidase with cupredoxin domain